MKPAADVFEFEEAFADSVLVERMWRTQSTSAEESFISVAASCWEIVVTRRESSPELALLGPETRASVATIPEDAEFSGIRFGLGAFLPVLPPSRLRDAAVVLQSSRSRVWFDGYRLEVPQSDDGDAFVSRLVRLGLLEYDPLVQPAIGGGVDGVSTRSLERRVSRATGLTRGAIRQIRRAERAVSLLSEGMRPVDVAYEVGYADQPHLTRSLRRFVGQTPAQIISPALGRG